MGQIQVFIPKNGGATVALPDKKAVLVGETLTWHVHCENKDVEKVKIDFNECIGDDEESLTQDYSVRVLDETHGVHVDLDQDAMLAIPEPLLGDNDDPRNFVHPIFQLLLLMFFTLSKTQG